ncbi:MAG TPA: hypothetical protein VKS21_13815 [Spirochaetota bacterium]|nr:hypothetical protein [Spirochaetota bacterium]
MHLHYYLLLITALSVTILTHCTPKPEAGQPVKEASRLYRKKNFNRLIRLYRNKKPADLPDPTLRFLLAKACFFSVRQNSNRLPVSESYLTSLTNTHPLFSEPYLYLARSAYFFKHQPARAEAVLHKLLQNHPQHLAANALLFKIYKNSGRNKLALKTARFLQLYAPDIREAVSFLDKKQ